MTSESKFWLQWFCESVLQPKGVEYRLVKEKEFNNKYDFFITGSDQVWGGGYLVILNFLKRKFQKYRFFLQERNPV